MKDSPNILVCPLDWGLGHATRIVPIIHLLIENQFHVTIAAAGNALIFLKNEFPDLGFIQFPNYKVRYSRSDSQIAQMIFLLPSLVFSSFKEHLKLKRIVKEKGIDIVFSDNRFGLWNRNTYCIFMTHQLRMCFPQGLKFAESIYLGLMRILVKKYDECWIPDMTGKNNLAGDLSHVTTFNVMNLYYVGPLSQFANENGNRTIQKEIDVLVVLSGPEPQRSILEDIIYYELKNCNLKVAMVRGSVDESPRKYSFPVFDLLNSDELKALIENSGLIICRSGYSSVMDLVVLGKKAVLIPTPGQPEQEYLAQYLMDKGLFYYMKQNSFKLDQALENAFENPERISFNEEWTLLEKRIKRLKEENYH